MSEVIQKLIKRFEYRLANGIGHREVNELSLKNLKDWVEKEGKK